MARIEGTLGQMDKRLNHIETEIVGLRNEIVGLRNELRGEIDGLRAELRTKADRWEIRIWFLLILILMTVYQFLR
ncbi:TPA: hypothetical protein EYP37_04365 [Candidatus Poribacteria bacterium]|nr:hypothetical protein [Candidatus Poribacteria bacterium]